MKTSDDTSTPAGTDVDEMLRRWPEVAPPAGGYDALVERTDKRVAEDRDVDDSLDVFAKPILPEIPGEPSSTGSNGEGPKLETLAALARESSLPPKRESRLPSKEPEKKESRSGVIDLKSMIAQSVAQEQENEAQKLASALAKDGAPSVGAATATTQPSTPVPVAATAAQPKKSSSNTLAIAAIVLIAGAGAYVMLNRNAPERGDVDQASADESGDDTFAAAPSVRQTPEPAAADRRASEDEPAPAAAVAPAATPTDSAEPEVADQPRERTREPGGHRPAAGPGASAGEGGREASGGATTAATPPPAETPAAAPAAPAEPAPAKRAARADLDALISGSLGSTSTPDPSAPAANTARAAAPEGALPQPNRQQIQRGMGRVAGAVRACASGQSGMVMLRITFSSDGSVSNATVASGPFAGSAAAGCMANAARAARVPAFTNASVTVSYPIMVQPPDPAAGGE